MTVAHGPRLLSLFVDVSPQIYSFLVLLTMRGASQNFSILCPLQLLLQGSDIASGPGRSF